MQHSETMRLNPPSLPTGGGAINGLKGDMAGAGPDGAVTLSIPLPVSAGRGYAPALTLSYHSRAGNGPFGIGWDIGLFSLRRHTRRGVPSYQEDTDEFTGPEGELLVQDLTSEGKAVQRSTRKLLGVKLPVSHVVRMYRSRIETNFSRLEYWQPKRNRENDFWVLYSPDGHVHLLGRNPQARISNPNRPSETAVWLLESSVSVTGEQIYYQYRAEDEAGCDGVEKTAHSDTLAQRYLVAVYYGNRLAGRTLPALMVTPVASDWLFILALDYGERSDELSDRPTWQIPGTGTWRCRQDCFSGYEYGFELRTRRLCRQVLMFHRLATLAGIAQGEDTPVLVSRLLLKYNDNPSVSTLISAQQLAHEPDRAGRTLSLPPLVFDWQTFTCTPTWQVRDDLATLNPWQPYQWIDLNGEGLASVLYRDQGAWWYRSPVRDNRSDDRDAVTWGHAVPLPTMPSLQPGGTLTDLNGDGRVQWVVTAAEVAGRYDRTPEGKWLHFTPLSALPIEYFHPHAQLADITGAGLSDMVLIGPRSVRLYAGTGAGWAKGKTIVLSDGITLPVPAADARTLVAFSDLLGSGQQHLVEIRSNRVRYWPNLGHGRFGQPVNLPGFSQPDYSFNPDRLFLADIDGSGTTDLIYALSDRLEIYLNQSGNRFAAPFSIPLPAGIRYDRTSSLQVADIQGLGISALVLSLSHPVPQHWVCHLATEKPWLLKRMNNHRGSCHTLHYRSSAQFWLDEKVTHQDKGETAPACYLPFALHTLCRSEVDDEITGNRLVSQVRYRHGVWDGREREFRGFGFVETCDTEIAPTQGRVDRNSMPFVNRCWFATGLPVVDKVMPSEYWQGDKAVFTGFTPRFTSGSGEQEQAYTPDDDTTAFCLNRALKGLLLRDECYGADGSDQDSIPYRVTENRPQVRLVRPALTESQSPVVWPVVVESRTYVYERVSSDPQCSQTVLLGSDDYGQPLRQLAICYPRRNKPAASPYSDRLPATLFASSYDEQQKKLRLTLQQRGWHAMANLDNGVWLLGVVNAERSDVFVHPSTAVSAAGLTLEKLLQTKTLLADQHATFAGQQQVWYLDTQDKATTLAPALPLRVAFTEVAVLDEAIVKALSGDITAAQLTEAGYQLAGYLFPRRDEKKALLWTACHGYTTYASDAHFWRPLSYRDTLLTGVVTVTWDCYDCVVMHYQDAAGLITQVDNYDWRFLTPLRVTDANDNVHTVTLDTLGRVIATRFYGTEAGKKTGYLETATTLPGDVNRALALKPPLPVAQCIVYVADSWMHTKDDSSERLPPHVLTLTTDRYDNDPAQQIHQQLTFSDGLGRLLQVAVRQPGGDAWQRAKDGSLVSGPDGAPQVAETAFRWLVSGRTEYNNKGQLVRSYQPYFLNDWRYVSDDSARQDLYADTYYYDPTGRVWQVKNAKGYRRQTVYTPWFTVNEDENDTASETAFTVQSSSSDSTR